MADYALAREGAEEAERARLALLAEVFDPLSERLLDTVGVGAGWRCLDAGAGAGAVTRILARRVGSSGSVVATDLDTRLLEELSGDVIEVRRHDLLEDPLPEGEFDLAHVRTVLMHLRSRTGALRRLRDAVRPGGWVAVLDADFTTIDVEPRTAAWKRTWSAFCDATVAAGWDYRYGARLHDDLEAVGLADVWTQGILPRGRGGSPRAELFAASLERMRERLRDVGARDADIDESQRLLRSPDTVHTDPTAWLGAGRRPA